MARSYPPLHASTRCRRDLPSLPQYMSGKPSEVQQKMPFEARWRSGRADLDAGISVLVLDQIVRRRRSLLPVPADSFPLRLAAVSPIACAAGLHIKLKF